MNLVIVESPNKCGKIADYLGPNYRVVATVGHFRDLPEKDLSVDIDTMQPTYVIDPKKRDVVKRLKAEAKKADQVLLATDPDREGEAIGWHVAQVLKLGKRAQRIVFHEITKAAVAAAVKAPVPIDQDLVDAQQARRVLDRIVGYQVSPLLQPLGKGLSAGRVQTATLHLVCARERERLDFRPEPYWVLRVTYENGLTAELADESGKPRKVKEASEAASAHERARISPHRVVSVERQEVEKKPPAPFTTSTLQQAASARLGLDPARTMQLAQALFEGGHITYHRSDSVALSDDAVRMARQYLKAHMPDSVPEKPPKYRSKAGAQEAHEAIRTTTLEPVQLAGDEGSLYELIRTRFLACQCKPARLARTVVVTAVGDGEEQLFFVARGTEVLQPHWLYLEKDQDDAGEGEDDPERQVLPAVEPEQLLEVTGTDLKEKHTQPPARFTEAGLVKEMEKLGIGRPSTYAATIATLYKRAYIEREKKALAPTPLGMKVDELMLAGLQSLTSHEYTAEMEAVLDEIASGKRRWDAWLKEWYAKFRPQLAAAARTWGEMIAEVRRQAAAGDEAAARAAGLDPYAPVCPECGTPMRRRKGKSGEFWGCPRFPECRQTLPIAAQAPARKKGDEASDITCPACGRVMVERKGTSGKFLGCSGYPECRETAPIELTKKRYRKCPECGMPLKKRKGRSGEFWGCTGFPNCRHTEEVKARIRQGPSS